MLVNGETETGLTLHRMIAKPDAGDIAAQVKVPIEETDTIRELYDKMVEAAGRLMAEVWPKLEAGLVEEVPQDESQASQFGRRRPADGLIDWTGSAKRAYDLVRAVTHPYPGAFTYYRGRKLFVWAAGHEPGENGEASAGAVLDRADLAVGCGRGSLIVRAAQWEGEEEISSPSPADMGLEAGDLLGSVERSKN